MNIIVLKYSFSQDYFKSAKVVNFRNGFRISILGEEARN